MPMHDWTRVSAGTYHNFHQIWTIQLMTNLNHGVLPDGYYAMADQRVQGPEPDVAALYQEGGPKPRGALSVLEAPPKALLQAKAESWAYAQKANRVRVFDSDDRVVAVLEIVSPGNKDNRNGFRSFVAKAFEFLTQGVHLVVVDPFPPGVRDPDGLHQAIWDEFDEAKFPPRPAGKPLTAASFEALRTISAYAEPFAVGDPVPATPLFLEPGEYVSVPLEASYQASWEALPPILRNRVL